MPGIYADVLEIIPQNEIDNFYNIIARESPTSTVVRKKLLLFYLFYSTR